MLSPEPCTSLVWEDWSHVSNFPVNCSNICLCNLVEVQCLPTEAIAGPCPEGPRRFLCRKGKIPTSSVRKRETSLHQASVLTSAANTWGCCGRHALVRGRRPLFVLLFSGACAPAISTLWVQELSAMGLSKPPCQATRVLTQPREARTSSPTNIPDLVPSSGPPSDPPPHGRRGQVFGVF